jgi:hypothetical protein
MGDLEQRFKGKAVKFTWIRGVVRDCVIEEETTSKGRRKVLVLQKIDFSECNARPPIRFRMGYYMKNGKKWIWARNSPVFRKEHLRSLVKKASMKGWM